MQLSVLKHVKPIRFQFAILSLFAPDYVFMDNHIVQFMVDFTMPQDLPEEFVGRIPQQRAAVNRMLSEGKILNYALSLENSRLWVVFSVQSETELIDLIESLPLTRFMKYRVSELTFYNASNPFVQAFSMN